jgi:DNA-binding NarL/FixJ family response regulator
MHPEPIKLAIVDDHQLFRKGISRILSDYGNIDVIIEAENGSDLFNKIEATNISPDVCMLDVNMPSMNGFETTKALKEKRKETKILIVSSHIHEYSIASLLLYGASGFLSKNTDPDTLVNAIVAIHENGYYHSELIHPKYLELLYNRKAKENMLTEREIEFTLYCCTNLHYNEIARSLNLSIKTIEGYRDSVFKKLNINSRSELVFVLR